MTLEEILQDIHTLEDELRAYERKYNVKPNLPFLTQELEYILKKRSKNFL